MELLNVELEQESILETLSELAVNVGISDEIKQALLQCFEHVAWVDDQGQTYYDALYDALYPPVDLSSISCVYTQSGTVYDTDSLDSLKADLVVTAHYSDSSTETITTYTLSGTLVSGTSTITVMYGGKTTTFDVSVNGNAFRYTPDMGLLSAQDYVTTTPNANITESIVDGSLRLYCPKLSSGQSASQPFNFVPNSYSTYCRMLVEFMVVDASWVQTTNQYIGWFGFRMGNTTDHIGSAMGVARDASTTGALKFRYYVGTSAATKVDIATNTWYTVEIINENGKQTIKLNNTTLIENGDLAVGLGSVTNNIYNMLYFSGGNTNPNELLVKQIDMYWE